jgi:WD40 repeat protein
MSNSQRAAFLFICITMLCSRISLGADAYTIGQNVEVREGDVWSAASVIAHEGRKYQVHYTGSDASVDEWVTSDRIRQPSGAAPAAVTAPHSAIVSQGPSNAGFNIGDNIEAKWGGMWRKATVANKTGNWTLVEYENIWYEWVQPWRLRQIGSSVDTTLDSTPRAFVSKSTPAPVDSATAGMSDPDVFHISETVGAGELPILKVSLAGHDISASRAQGPPAADAKVTAADPKVIPLHQGKSTGRASLDLLVNPQGKVAAVVTKPANEREAGSIQFVDLAAGSLANSVTLVSRVQPLAINDDGTRLVTRSDKVFPATKWRLDLWAVDADTIKPLLSFRPYLKDTNGADQVRWASFLDASHLLSCSGDHAVSLWQVSDTAVQKIYTLQGDSTLEPSLSTGRKYVTLGFGRAVVVVEALTGKCVARCVTDINQMASCINPDATRVALCGGSRLVICDLQTGKTISDMGLPVGVTGSAVDWIGPNLLLIDKGWIYDTQHHAIVWEFKSQTPPPLSRWMGDRLWVLLDGENAALGSANLLDSAVLNADKQLSDAEYAVQPGTKVSLQIDLSCDSKERKKIVEAITNNAEKAGLVIAENQPVKLVADSKDINPREVTYQGRGFDRGRTETVNVSNTVEFLSLVIDSKPVWSVNSGIYNGAPMMVLRKQNETVAQTLDQQKKAKLSWFSSVGIPKAVMKPSDPASSSPLMESIGQD